MFGKDKAPLAVASHTGLVGAPSRTARGKNFSNPTTYARYSQASISIIGITGLNDSDNTLFAAPWVPPSATSLAAFQRLWVMYDAADYEYVGGGPQTDVNFETQYVSYIYDFEGTYDYTSTIVGSGRVPSSNDYLTAWSSSFTDLGYYNTTSAPPGNPNSEVYLDTLKPDPSSATTSPVFDTWRYSSGGGPVPAESFFASNRNTMSYSSDSSWVAEYFWPTQLAYSYNCTLSNPTPIAALYNQNESALLNTNVFQYGWDSGTGSICIGWNMPTDTTIPATASIYDGSEVISYGTSGGPSRIPPGLSNVAGWAGWDVSAASTDGNRPDLFRCQVSTNDGHQHSYFVFSVFYNSTYSNPGDWKMTIVDTGVSGYMYPLSGSSRAVVEIPYPSGSKGYPISGISGQPVTTHYNGIVVGMKKSDWLASNGLASGSTSPFYTTGIVLTY